MAENEAMVSAFWLQFLAADVVAGVRHNPRVEGRVRHLAAETGVADRDLLG